MPRHGGKEPTPAGIEIRRGPRNSLGAEADKDRPLREDTRLLGRILGDTVREQHEPPRPRAAWIAGRWLERPEGWVWEEGHWD